MRYSWRFGTAGNAPILVFFSWDPDSIVKDSFRYLGKGVKLGDKDRIVCWYKLKDAKDPEHLPSGLWRSEREGRCSGRFASAGRAIMTANKAGLYLSQTACDGLILLLGCPQGKSQRRRKQRIKKTLIDFACGRSAGGWNRVSFSGALIFQSTNFTLPSTPGKLNVRVCGVHSSGFTGGTFSLSPTMRA